MRGSFVLAVGILLLLLSPWVYSHWLKEEYTPLSQDQTVLDSLIQLVERQNEPQVAPEPEPKNYFPFDPNQASQETLEQLGIPDYLAARMIRYREEGGVFRRKADVKKIYQFPEKLYLALEDFIELPEISLPARKPKEIRMKQRSFDINQADTAQLSQLRGIGSVLSERIVKFREALGGYHSPSQWAEVYNISEMALEQLAKYTYIDEDFVPEKLKINTLEFKELMQHPYISYELTKAIFQHRQVYGPFTSAEDLKEVSLVDEKLQQKLLPYLSFE